ncbi:unnamed protein product [Angiostrongylus costaricensis]|uniref:Transposase n=1 Tax=Angiostrongylus costaricensis TaxID=334426 RepID=A0A0R3PTE9_ANGCS|nr:unnamed protein product [Angiostrongylus costaricensis]
MRKKVTFLNKELSDHVRLSMLAYITSVRFQHSNQITQKTNVMDT